MQNQLLIGDAFPTAADRINVDQAAMQAAAYGDAVQANRLANRVKEMQLKSALEDKAVQNYLAQNWATMDPSAPQPPPGAEQAPANQLAPKPMTGVGAGVPMPAMDNSLAPPAPKQPQATSGRQQFPSDEELMAAVKGGKLPFEVASGVRQQRITAEQGQHQEQMKSKQAYYKDLASKFVEAGNNEGFQALMKQAQEDPDVKGLIPKFDSVKITGKQEVETIKNFSAEEIKALAQSNPELGINEQTQPGTYKMARKGGQITKWEPAKASGADNPFTTFEAGMRDDLMQKGVTNKGQQDRLISEAWQKQLEKQMQSRIPGATFQGFDEQGNPIVFDRRSGNVTVGKSSEPGLASAVATYSADKKALGTLTQREQLIKSFTTRIDANAKLFEGMRAKYGQNWSRMANVPINKAQSMMGSGDYKSLQLVLKSLSNEVAKVESGSLGISEPSVSQAEFMHKIHDPDMTMADIMKVIDTSRALGKTSAQAIGDQRKELQERLGKKSTKLEETAQYAKNPQTGHRIKSTDGGKTWVDADTGKPL